MGKREDRMDGLKGIGYFVEEAWMLGYVVLNPTHRLLAGCAHPTNTNLGYIFSFQVMGPLNENNDRDTASFSIVSI